MILVRPSDIRHKAQLLRLLTEIADNSFLAQNLYFKGGTCASMQGYLDRFSVDLDFDLNPQADKAKIRKNLEEIFSKLDLVIKDQSKKVPEYFLGYSAPQQERNTLKIDAFGPKFSANVYKPVNLIEIDRIMYCQTIETMFANKLVAPIDRFETNTSVAGRDIYDLHHFFYNGYVYEKAVITERTSLSPKKYLEKLVKFIEKNVTETIINQDLNTLLLPHQFQKIRKVLKQELITFLKNEILKY